MHWKSLFFIIFLVSLNSCFIADSLFEEPSPEKEPSLQERSEKVVRKHINELKETAIYTPYGFSNLIIKKPAEIDELEQMERRLRITPEDTILQQKIKAQKTFNIENNIERTVELEHFFTLASDSSSINILEVKYILNDTLGIKEKIPSIILTIPVKYEEALTFYFNEYTIILEDTYAESRSASKNFYRFFKSRLESLNTVQAKSDFLKHTLDICYLLRQNSKFNQNIITQSLLKQYISEKRKDITEYTPLKFSALFETINKEDETLLGYYFFHKFIGNYENKRDTNVVLVEFTPYYEVNTIFLMDGSFESYNTPTK